MWGIFTNRCFKKRLKGTEFFGNASLRRFIFFSRPKKVYFTKSSVLCPPSPSPLLSSKQKLPNQKPYIWKKIRIFALLSYAIFACKYNKINKLNNR